MAGPWAAKPHDEWATEWAGEWWHLGSWEPNHASIMSAREILFSVVSGVLGMTTDFAYSLLMEALRKCW